MKLVHGILALTITIALSAPAALAQQPPTTSARPPRPCENTTVDNVHTFYLKSAAQPSDANEIYTALRNMLPPDNKSFLVASQNAIIVCGNPDQVALAQKLINEIDHRKKLYRLTYTVTEMDGAKRIGSQHFAMVAAAGQPTVLKQGSKVPVATGTFDSGSSAPKAGVQTQFTYLDVGMNFDATVVELANGVQLRTKVEQSSIAEERSGVGPQDPVVRQVALTGSSFLTPGKPLMLGSVDIPSTTRHLDIEVVMEELP